MKYNSLAKPSIFTAQNYDTKTTVEIDHSDLDLEEVMEAFQTLIIGMKYSNDSFKNWVLYKADEYQQNENDANQQTEIEHTNSQWNKEPLINQTEWNKRRDSLGDMMENYINVPISFSFDEFGKKKYNFEDMKLFFENKIKELEHEQMDSDWQHYK